MSECLCICVFMCLLVCISIVCVSACLSICVPQCIYLHDCVSACLSVCISKCIHELVHLCACMSAFLPVHHVPVHLLVCLMSLCDRNPPPSLRASLAGNLSWTALFTLPSPPLSSSYHPLLSPTFPLPSPLPSLPLVWLWKGPAALGNPPQCTLQSCWEPGLSFVTTREWELGTEAASCRKGSERPPPPAPAGVPAAGSVQSGSYPGQQQETRPMWPIPVPT